MISQIAFPESSGSAVETVNSATAYGYTKGMTGYTYNASDNVFSDGTSTEMSTVTGSLNAGYTLSWDAYVSAAVTTGINDLTGEEYFQIRQNFPNPCSSLTKIPVVLKTAADIKVTVMSTTGAILLKQSLGNMTAGEQMIDLNVSALPIGTYIYTVKVTTLSGIFSQSKLFTKI
jgi:hypothetical protein